jgi:hypothetical protein
MTNAGRVWRPYRHKRTENFSGNGGLRNMSAELSQRFQEVYAGVIKAVRDEHPAATMLYATVDTIGCVELKAGRGATIPGGADRRPGSDCRRRGAGW